MNKNDFHAWLRKNGAEVLAPTNVYEFARFIARGQTCVVYEGRRGISANGFAGECFEAWQNKQSINMGFNKKGGSHAARRKHALFNRDGASCFFCRKTMEFEEATIEHLVARVRGGPDHDDNLALAHEACNAKAANLPLMEKIKLREKF